jgi:hypothetical protein
LFLADSDLIYGPKAVQATHSLFVTVRVLLRRLLATDTDTDRDTVTDTAAIDRSTYRQRNTSRTIVVVEEGTSDSRW